MCGNGMRCVARYLDEHDGRATATVETLAGPDRHAHALARAVPRRRRDGRAADRRAAPGRRLSRATPVELGNPHVVIRVDDVARARPGTSSGRASSATRGIPHGTNVHFVARDGDRWRVRHWERGAGATQACGTGAVAVAAVLIAARRRSARRSCCTSRAACSSVEWQPGARATLIGDAVREFERIARVTRPRLHRRARPHLFRRDALAARRRRDRASAARATS